MAFGRAPNHRGCARSLHAGYLRSACISLPIYLSGFRVAWEHRRELSAQLPRVLPDGLPEAPVAPTLDFGVAGSGAMKDPGSPTGAMP